MKNWKEYLKRKLIMPMKRNYSSPNYLARSTAVGMSLAFAPIMGQIPVVGALWLLGRKFKWRFSLAIAIFWTFISNFFTNLPLFYLYYKIGDLVRQKNEGLSYDALKGVFKSGMFDGLKFMLSELGLSIAIGSTILMIAFGFIGYGIGYLIASINMKPSKQDK